MTFRKRKETLKSTMTDTVARITWYRHAIIHNKRKRRAPLCLHESPKKDKKKKLLLAESFRFFYGERHLLDQLFVTFVRWQVQTVETSVRTRQPRLFAHFLDTEALRSVAPYESKNPTAFEFYFY